MPTTEVLPKLLAETMSCALTTICNDERFYRRFAQRTDIACIIELNSSLSDLNISAQLPIGDARVRTITSEHPDYCVPDFFGFTSKPEFPRRLAVPTFMVSTRNARVIAQGFAYPVHDAMCLCFYMGPERAFNGAFVYADVPDQIALLQQLRNEHMFPLEYEMFIQMTMREMAEHQRKPASAA